MELLVVAIAQSAIVAAKRSWLEAIGAAAVTLTFAHAQVADRLAEAEGAREILERLRGSAAVGVECFRWQRRYYVSKELLWLSYFSLLQAWSALAGVVIFLLYPLWRHAWRRWHPRPIALQRMTTCQ
jgi:hypothetical protein